MLVSHSDVIKSIWNEFTGESIVIVDNSESVFLVTKLDTKENQLIVVEFTVFNSILFR